MGEFQYHLGAEDVSDGNVDGIEQRRRGGPELAVVVGMQRPGNRDVLPDGGLHGYPDAKAAQHVPAGFGARS